MTRFSLSILTLVPTAALTSAAHAVDLRVQTQTVQNSPYYDGYEVTPAQSFSPSLGFTNYGTPSYPAPAYRPAMNAPVQSMPYQQVFPSTYPTQRMAPQNYSGYWSSRYPVQAPIYYGAVPQTFPSYGYPVQNRNSQTIPVAPFRCDPVMGCNFR